MDYSFDPAVGKALKDYNEEISDESEDFVETAMAAITDYLTKIAPELFPEKLLRPNYTEADISEDRSKLPDYNGMISGCLLTVNESGTEISCDAKKDVSIGEYQTIAPEEAAKHLKLREDEKPAILYIFSEQENRTFIRPVYTKYVEQSEFYDRILEGGTCIDALK